MLLRARREFTHDGVALPDLRCNGPGSDRFKQEVADVNARLVVTKAEAKRLWRLMGVAPEEVEQLDAELPEPIDIDRDGEVLQQHGITRDNLISVMGGSP